MSWDSRRLDAVSFGDLIGVPPFSIHMPIAASKECDVIFTCVIR